VASDRQYNPEHSAGLGRVNRGYLPVVRFHNGSRNGSPMPIPSALVVKNGSNTSFSLSAGIPGPRSDIESSAKFSTREVRRLTMRFSPGVPDIASIALTTRFGMTC